MCITVPEKTIHNLNTGENFSTIQAAIDDSDTKDGDTITVDPGTYLLQEIPRIRLFSWNAHYDAAGNDHYNLNDEYIVLKNIGGTSINLEGRVMQDKENHTYVFPCFELQPGATVTIHTGSGTDTATDLYWGSKRAIWNNKGDVVYLYGPNKNLVDTKSW